MSLSMRWFENSVDFVYQGDVGAVSLSAVNIDGHWHPREVMAHRPQRGVHRYAGVCPYVTGPCEPVQIELRRAVVPVARWERHHNDPAVIEKILLQWYEEFVR
jgi:hypothetical protein